MRTFEIMRETYADFGYERVELPRVSVANRADFVVAALGVNGPR